MIQFCYHEKDKEGNIVKKSVKFVLWLAVGVFVVLYSGAMLNFFPFFTNELVAGEILFCTFVICVVVGICTAIILSRLDRR